MIKNYNCSLRAVFLSAGLVPFCPLPTKAASLLSFDLNGITGGQNESGTQFQTGYSIRYNASLTGWTHSGFHAIHALQISQDNWAMMIYSGFNTTGSSNLLTQTTGFAANELGTQYYVSYNIGPTVYVVSNQKTRADDKLRISVINSMNQAVGFTDVAPGAWDESSPNPQAFKQAYFSYTGNGTGLVRLQFGATNPGSDVFVGAVDNISFEATEPVLEPLTLLLFAIGGMGMLWVRRRITVQ